MLPKLPLNIIYIDVTACTSLETLSLRPEDNFLPEFRLLNCHKLIKNQGYGDLFSTMLRRYIINNKGEEDDSFHAHCPLHQLHIQDYGYMIGPGLEVTRCGGHLVFERDIEDLINQTKAGRSNCIITPNDEDGFDDSQKDIKIKRSSDDSDGEGAGPSNEEPQHLKWIRHPDLIENWFGNSDCEEEESH
ncbi:hypothetical protein CMV_022823 [Castanea mollissima]|nr:hypothetical protein CMV_022823 [Castanea mollissima]